MLCYLPRPIEAESPLTTQVDDEKFIQLKIEQNVLIHRYLNTMRLNIFSVLDFFLNYFYLA